MIIRKCPVTVCRDKSQGFEEHAPFSLRVQQTLYDTGGKNERL